MVKMETPRWALEIYDGDVVDFTKWLRGVIRHDMYGDMAFDSDGEVRAEAEVMHRVLKHTIEMEDMTSRSTVWQLYDAHKNGWHRYLPAEYGTVGEMLDIVISDNNISKSKASDLAFVVESLLPALEKMGVPPEKVIAVPYRISKVREAVPSMRAALREPDGKRRTRDLKEIVDWIADDEVSVRDLRERLMKGRHEDNGFKPLTGTSYVMPDGDWLLVKAPTPAYREAVKGALKGIVEDWELGDIRDLIQEVARI
jgi:hypothetical protein